MFSERTLIRFAGALFVIAGISEVTHAQVPPAMAAELRKMGQGVLPACTAKLYRPLMPKNDYNTYWPPDAPAPLNLKNKLFPGVTLARDVQFGQNPKDLVDIFVGDKGPSNNRTVLIYVPGGGGNKIEQQSPESNAFYDNIGRWATDNDMVGITLQRSATNIPVLIDWLKTNAAKYKANPDRIFIWAHSAGNGPLTEYISRPDLYGVGVNGAVFMSGWRGWGGGGNAGRGAGRGAAAPGGGAPTAGAPAASAPQVAAAPAAGAQAAARGGQGGGGRGGANANTSDCQEAGMAATSGSIRGPSSQLADQGKDAASLRNSPIHWDGKLWVKTETSATAAAPAAGGGRGGVGGGGGGRGGGAPAAGAATEPAFTAEDGFKTTRTAIMIAYAELDTGITNAQMPANVMTAHDALCKLEGPKAKDGVGHCPTLFMAKDHSHMSEVFSIGTPDRTVSGAILEFIKAH